jgi:hypothetical protein
MGSTTSYISMKLLCVSLFLSRILFLCLSLLFLRSHLFLSSCNNTRACVRFLHFFAVCVCVVSLTKTKRILCLVFDIFLFLKTICCVFVCVCVCGVCCIDNVIFPFFWYVYMRKDEEEEEHD